MYYEFFILYFSWKIKHNFPALNNFFVIFTAWNEGQTSETLRMGAYILMLNTLVKIGRIT